MRQQIGDGENEKMGGGNDRWVLMAFAEAQQVLAQFAQTARDETDMDKLTAEWVRVVQETLQPEQVRVWLRQDLMDSSHYSNLDGSPKSKL